MDDGWTKGKASSVSLLKGHTEPHYCICRIVGWHFWQPAADVFVCLWQPLRLLGIRFKVEGGGIVAVVMCWHVNKFGGKG